MICEGSETGNSGYDLSSSPSPILYSRPDRQPDRHSAPAFRERRADGPGTQAVRALREEGYRVILVNSNPATIMADSDSADITYKAPAP
jgi:hypothetical protein